MAPPAASITANGTTEPHPAATFLVRGIVVLGTRSLFIVRGSVVSGSVRAKQRVIGLPGMEGEVQSVEANLLDINGGAAQSALTFHYAKQAELARWKALVAEGTLLMLGAPV
jgi:hypothetical protein